MSGVRSRPRPPPTVSLARTHLFPVILTFAWLVLLLGNKPPSGVGEGRRQLRWCVRWCLEESKVRSLIGFGYVRRYSEGELGYSTSLTLRQTVGLVQDSAVFVCSILTCACNETLRVEKAVFLIP